MRRIPCCVITGCSSGIGYHLAHTLHALNWPVLATARREQDCKQLRAEGLHAHALDLNEPHSITQLVRYIEESFSECHVLIHNAGFAQAGAFEDLSSGALREQFETQVFGPHALTTQLLPLFHSHPQAHIIAISSMLTYVPLAFRSAYIASKCAWEAMLEILAIELRQTAICVTLIQPGPISSRFRTQASERFSKNIAPCNSRYEKDYAAYLSQYMNTEQVPGMQGPSAVVRSVIEALLTPQQLRYRVTWPAHLFYCLQRCLPASLYHRLLCMLADRHV